MSYIETDKLLQELLSTIGYASQTLRLHPEKDEKVAHYLRTMRVLHTGKLEEHQANLDILARKVVF